MCGCHTFAAEEYGKIPELGHIERFENLALVAGTVPVEADGRVFVVLVLIREGNTRTNGYLSADYTVATVESFGEHVHGSAFSVGDTFSSAKQLADNRFDRSTTHESKPVTSVSGDYVVFFRYSMLNACCNRFLAGGKMAETPDFFFLV